MGIVGLGVSTDKVREKDKATVPGTAYGRDA